MLMNAYMHVCVYALIHAVVSMCVEVSMSLGDGEKEDGGGQILMHNLNLIGPGLTG